MTYRELSSEEAYDLFRNDKERVIVDVRSPGEFNGPGGHVPGSVLIPLQELAARWKELEAFKDRPLLLVCRTGNRSGMAAGFLAKQGFSKLFNTPGILEWNERGYEVERSAASAERRP